MKRKRKQQVKEKRRQERVGAALPVKAGRALGVTRDVSASGMFLETDTSYTVGSAVNIALSLATPWGKVMVQSRGKIVRLERHDKKIGVAVQFIDSKSVRRKV